MGIVRSLIAILCVVSSVVVAGAEVLDGILATVNGEPITISEHAEALWEFRMQKKAGGEKEKAADVQAVLDALISNKLVMQKALEEGIDVSDREIDEKVQQIFDENNLDEARLETELKNAGKSLDEYRSDIRKSLMAQKLMMKMVSSRVKRPSDEAIEAFYKKNKSQMRDPAKVRVRTLLLQVKDDASFKDVADVEKTIRSLKVRVDKGEEFSALAKKYSEDFYTREKGGDLGFFREGMMTPQFEQLVFSLTVGKPSEPIRTERGYEIYLVEKKDKARTLALADVADGIAQQIMMGKMQEMYGEWVQEIRALANIRIHRRKNQ